MLALARGSQSPEVPKMEGVNLKTRCGDLQVIAGVEGLSKHTWMREMPHVTKRQRHLDTLPSESGQVGNPGGDISG